MVQRCACILLIEQAPEVSATEIAMALTGQNSGEEFQARYNDVVKMTTLGSYYRALEVALGKGVTLALGSDIAETT